MRPKRFKLIFHFENEFEVKMIIGIDLFACMSVSFLRRCIDTVVKQNTHQINLNLSWVTQFKII